MSETMLKRPNDRELVFTETTKDEFLQICFDASIEAVDDIQNSRPDQIKHPLGDEQIRALHRRGLQVYEELSSIQAEKKTRVYPRSIDIVHVYSGPYTTTERGMQKDARGNFTAPRRSRDYDRVIHGIAVAREVARARARVDGYDEETMPLPEILQTYSPIVMYDGQLHENTAFRQFIGRPEFPNYLPPEKIRVFDYVDTPGNARTPIKHTGHQVLDFMQECTRADGALHELYTSQTAEGKKLGVGVVSHNSGIVRIPFYFGNCRELGVQSPGEEGDIAMYLYGARDRTVETAEEILKYELVGLAKYAASGFLSTEPYPYHIPAYG